MKKYIFIIISLFISVSANAQQAIPSEFFGLKYGNTYSLEEVISHVGDNGRYSSTNFSEFESLELSGYLFENVTYCGRTYTSMTIHFHSKVFVGIIFSISNTERSQSFNSIYHELDNELSDKYDMIDYPVSNDEINKISIDDNGNAVAIGYRESHNGNIAVITYLSLTTLFSDITNKVLPTIQDTFFGLKMGTRQTTSTIKWAVGDKGTLLSEDKDIYGKTITFKDITFAGKVWDFGEFRLTENGELYDLSVQISLKDYGFDDLKEANRTFESFKTKLEEKYGTAEEKTDEAGKRISYIGNNGIGLMLSNERSKSKGGDYRRYVTLEYWHTEIHSQLYNQSNDEL